MGHHRDPTGLLGTPPRPNRDIGGTCPGHRRGLTETSSRPIQDTAGTPVRPLGTSSGLDQDSTGTLLRPDWDVTGTRPYLTRSRLGHQQGPPEILLGPNRDIARIRLEPVGTPPKLARDTAGTYSEHRRDPLETPTETCPNSIGTPPTTTQDIIGAHPEHRRDTARTLL